MLEKLRREFLAVVVFGLTVSIAYAGPVIVTPEPNVLQSPTVESDDTFSWTVSKGTSAATSTDWFDTSYAYSEDIYIDYSQSIPRLKSYDDGYGTIVYKFDVGSPAEVDIAAHYVMAWWGYGKATLYFSDVNDWSQLTPMTGSQVSQWGEAELFEDNSDWTLVDTYESAYLSSTVQDDLIGNTLTSSDGVFYVRVDLASFTGPAAGNTILNELTVSGQIIPEPATAIVVVCGGLICTRIKRKK